MEFVVQSIVDNLNKRFVYLIYILMYQFFLIQNPCDEETYINAIEYWLEILIMKFELKDIENDVRRVELLKFV